MRTRRDLDGGNITGCAQSWWYERYVGDGENRTLVVNATVDSPDDACVVILDLASKNPDARGFRKGFVGYPYGFLAAGEFSVIARLDMRNFTLESAILLDLADVDSTYGGFSGGFSDGSWSCFCPFKQFAGSQGGIRSRQLADGNTLRAYYSSQMICVNSTGWEGIGDLASSLRVIDMGDLDPNLRGYSEAIRVGRYAYIAPLASFTYSYTSRVVRLQLGPVDIANTLDALAAAGVRARALLSVLDLSQKSEDLKGFSSLFSGMFFC